MLLLNIHIRVFYTYKVRYGVYYVQPTIVIRLPARK